MSLTDRESQPVPARRHRTAGGGRALTAGTMLAVYLVLLVAIPSNLTIAALGGFGRPSVLWGLLLLFWWLLTRLQMRAVDAVPVTQPVRIALIALVVIVLVCFASLMLRGQPADQISPAITALLRLASWSGVLLVAMDGIRTHDDAARIVRALAIAGGGVAALGLAQFITGQSLLDWVSSIPGISVDGASVATRSAFTRASATAAHPLEYGTALVGLLPIAIGTAVARGFPERRQTRPWIWWTIVGLIMAAALLSVSRSAILGLAVALVASLPAIPQAYRWLIGVGGAIVTAVVIVVVPGMLGTVVSLFAGASDDPSTQSRSDAVARVPEFIATSPWIGQGFGTFLPRYYIFDNQWVLLTVEIGILGVLAFAAVVASAFGSAAWAARVSPFEDTKAMGRSLAASVLTIAVLFVFFDGLSFPISGGLLFLIVGLTAAMRTIAAADIGIRASAERLSTFADSD